MKNQTNHKTHCFSALTLLFILFISNAFAQSSSGNDFWVTFMPNYYEDPDYPLSLSLVATAHHACSVTITNAYYGFSEDFEVPADGEVMVNIPKQYAYVENASDVVLNNAFHVTATDEISLFAANFRGYTFDVGKILPINALGSEYVLQTYPSNGYSDWMRADFSIIAVEDNTTVQIYLTCQSKGGHYAYQPFEISLNAGESYQVQSKEGGDFSGTWIRVYEGKRVAVFAGDRGTAIPDGYPAVDAVFDQLPPVNSWGKHFVVTGCKEKGSDRVRVTALNDGCKVYKDGILGSTLNERETVEFELDGVQPTAYIETSEPALVCLYITGCTYSKEGKDVVDNEPDGIYAKSRAEIGDPAMVIIPPLEQATSNYATFPVFDQGVCNRFYVNVVTETDKVSGITLDDVNMAFAFQEVPGNPEYSFARLYLSRNTHKLENTAGSFVAHTYGLGEAESYAFVVGSKVMDLTSQITVNEEPASNTIHGFEACEDETMHFGLQTNYVPTSVQWNFGDGSMAVGYPVDHAFDSAGQYQVSCEVRIPDQSPSVLTTNIQVHPNYHIEMEQIACESFDWNGETYTQSGDYEYHGESVSGCDSLVVLHLTIGRGQVSDTAATACAEFTWYGETYEVSGWYHHFLQSHLGCDSIVWLNLTVTHGPFEAQLHGPEWIAASTDIMGGTYKYYVSDSLHIAPNTLEWTCTNPGWVLYPKGDGYRCEVWATGIGQGDITAWTGAECDTVYVRHVTATWYDLPENELAKVKVYPNPAQNQVSVEAAGIQHIRLMDALGQTVFESDYDAVEMAIINIDGLSQGVYMAEISTKVGKFLRKIVVGK